MRGKQKRTDHKINKLYNIQLQLKVTMKNHTEACKKTNKNTQNLTNFDIIVALSFALLL